MDHNFQENPLATDEPPVAPKFDVLVRRAIPYLGKLLFLIVVILLFVVMVFYAMMSPAENGSAEMATAYYIMVIPDILKYVFLLAFIGLVVFIFLYNAAKFTRPAVFWFNDDNIYIRGKKVDLVIPQSSISQIYFNDLMTIMRKPRNKIQVVFKRKNKRTSSFYLLHYEDAQALIDALSKLNSIPISFYDDRFNTDDEDEPA